MKVGILTGGGDCPGLNAVIRAAVKTGIARHGFEMLGIEDAFHGLVDLGYQSPHGNRWLTEMDVRGIQTRGGTILGTSNRGDPFHYVVKSESGKEIETDISDRVLENMHRIGLDAIISIGGDGSMRIAQRFFEKGMPIVGVPKTIDNDLGATDQTFGFDTAVCIATEAIDRLSDTAASHDRVMLVEVMGRDAGWIALHAGLAGGADAILIPEIPYRIDAIAKMIAQRSAAKQKYSIIVVSEGAKPLGGDRSIGETRAGAMPRLMGAGSRVAEGLRELVSADIRVTVLGHIQRGGPPSSFDRNLATRYGRAAADLVATKQFGRMVALRDGQIVTLPIADAIAKPKLVDPKSEMVETARALGTFFGDEP
ncbi:6-phosphofructokinase [Sandaracinus amylolyticus]|nr:ATP-dependent 6-phosphofructokinase [Sandaracinus amylolyticus]